MDKKKYLYSASLSAAFNTGERTIFVNTVATHWQDVEDDDIATNYFLHMAQERWPTWTDHKVEVVLAYVENK